MGPFFWGFARPHTRTHAKIDFGEERLCVGAPHPQKRGLLLLLFLVKSAWVFVVLYTRSRGEIDGPLFFWVRTFRRVGLHKNRPRRRGSGCWFTKLPKESSLPPRFVAQIHSRVCTCLSVVEKTAFPLFFSPSRTHHTLTTLHTHTGKYGNIFDWNEMYLDMVNMNMWKYN